MDSLKNLLITDSEEVRPNWAHQQSTGCAFSVHSLGAMAITVLFLRLRRWIWKSMAISISYF